ncbi:MAG: GNAT family N-acetyltransferase [Anaerolineae bacterium]|nr:GNAT family N-acetyltransferase [Anaerolineae bacterium]
MIEIRAAQTGEALEHFITLSQEYVDWMLDEIRAQYPELDIREFTSEHDYDDVRHKFPGEHTPPDGCLLIATDGDDVCGCIALGRLTETVAEMRTLFVRPSCRGKGVGKALAEASLSEARKFGYRTIRLDTLGFMASAQGLYRSLGFRDIPPYLDMSDALKAYICFMELDLGD